MLEKEEGMKYSDMSPRQQKILLRLSKIPKRILALHEEVDEVTELVMHELCGNECFDLDKAAYLIDNPDFDCCKGIAGYNSKECCESSDDIWCRPCDFGKACREKKFNKRVRSHASESLGGDLDEKILEVAQELEMHQPGYYSWELKNGNRGILIFEERGENTIDDIKEHLEYAFSLLGFCPIS